MEKVKAVTAVEDEAAEAAAFSAVFNPDHEPEVEPEVEVPETNEGPEENGDEPIVGTAELTVSDLKAMLDEQRESNKKGHDAHQKLAGTVGKLQQRIDAAKVQAAGFSPKVKERVTAEFPELAQLLFDDGIESPVDDNDTPSKSVLTTDSRVDDLSRTFERKLLTRDHRDWEQVVISQEFADWKIKTLPPEELAELDESWDADYVSGKIADFKAFKKDKESQVLPNNEFAIAEKKKKERLDLSITPRGIPRAVVAGNGQDDEETAAFKAAFKPPPSRR